MARNAVQRNPNLKMEDARRAYEPNAETMVKWYYLTKRIAEAENIEVTDEDVQEFLEKNIEDEEKRKEILANKASVERIKDDLFYEKVMKFLEENNEIKENEIELD
jgi:trigger factor